MHLARDGHAERLGSSGRWDITENSVKVIEGGDKPATPFLLAKDESDTPDLAEIIKIG